MWRGRPQPLGAVRGGTTVMAVGRFELSLSSIELDVVLEKGPVPILGVFQFEDTVGGSGWDAIYLSQDLHTVHTVWIFKA